MEDATTVCHPLEIRLGLESVAKAFYETVVELHQIELIVRAQVGNDLPGDGPRAGAYLENPTRLAIVSLSDEARQGPREAAATGQYGPRGAEVPAKFAKEEPAVG